MESKKQNEQTKQKQTHIYREQSDGCQRGGKWADGQNTGRRLEDTKFKL